MVLLVSGGGSYLQFITVLLIFVIVLGITALTTKWISNYQKQQCTNENVQVIETTRIANNKYVQIIRAGEKYMVVAVCKDTVTMLGEIPKEQIKENGSGCNTNFKDILSKTLKKDGTVRKKPKENQLHDKE